MIPSTTIPSTVYLSEKAVAEAHRVFEQLSSKASIDCAFDFSNADWNDFDKIYLDLYQLSLLHEGEKGALNSSAIHNDDRFASVRSCLSKDESIVQVDCMLDLHLQVSDNPHHFLSEFAVHSLIAFRNAFANTVRLQTVVTYVDVGCIVMGFGVRLPNAEKLAALRDESVADVGRKLVLKRLATKRWGEIKQRFSVMHSYVDGKPV